MQKAFTFEGLALNFKGIVIQLTIKIMAKKSFIGALDSLLAEIGQSPVKSHSGGLSILLGETEQCPVVKPIKERQITTTMKMKDMTKNESKKGR